MTYRTIDGTMPANPVVGKWDGKPMMGSALISAPNITKKYMMDGAVVNATEQNPYIAYKVSSLLISHNQATLSFVEHFAGLVTGS